MGRTMPSWIGNSDLDIDGVVHRSGAAAGVLADLEDALATLPQDQAGVRVYGVPGL